MIKKSISLLITFSSVVIFSLIYASNTSNKDSDERSYALLDDLRKDFLMSVPKKSKEYDALNIHDSKIILLNEIEKKDLLMNKKSGFIFRERENDLIWNAYTKRETNQKIDKFTYLDYELSHYIVLSWEWNWCELYMFRKKWSDILRGLQKIFNTSYLSYYYRPKSITCWYLWIDSDQWHFVDVIWR